MINSRLAAATRESQDAVSELLWRHRLTLEQMQEPRFKLIYLPVQEKAVTYGTWGSLGEWQRVIAHEPRDKGGCYLVVAHLALPDWRLVPRDEGP